MCVGRGEGDNRPEATAAPLPTPTPHTPDVIYDKPNGVFNNTACSTAIPSSTTDTAAAGCVSKGVLSRFAYANATVTGNEEVLATGSWCSQFTNAGMGDLKSHNGVLYVSAGVGSGESESVPADYGQFGGDPCGGGGAFRAQDDDSCA